jgi:hypothetical protein
MIEIASSRTGTIIDYNVTGVVLKTTEFINILRNGVKHAFRFPFL